jgi:hypothetical protein
MVWRKYIALAPAEDRKVFFGRPLSHYIDYDIAVPALKIT